MCFRFGEVKALSRVPKAIEIQSEYSPWSFDQNSEEPQRVQNCRTTDADDVKNVMLSAPVRMRKSLRETLP
tara:strand:- start:8845 stop:9057 length:213 start_codon:yes stop_codon:yes gene_type:complete